MRLKDTLVKNSLKSAVFQGTDQALMLIFSLTIATQLGKEKFGELSFILFGINLLTTLSSSGNSYYFLRSKDVPQRTNVLLVKQGMVLTVMLSSVFYWYVFNNSYAFLIFVSVMTYSYNNYTHFLSAKGLAPKGHLFGIIRAALTILNVIIYVRFENLLISFIVFGVSIMLGAKRTILSKYQNHKVNWSLYFQSLSQNIIGILFKHLDMILIQLFLGYSIVGDYAIVVSFSSLASFGLMALNSNAQKELMEMREEANINSKRIEEISKMALISGVILSLMTIILFFLYSNYVNTEYNLNIYVLLVLLSAQLVNTITGPVALILNVFKGPTVVTKITLGVLLIKVLLVTLIGTSLIKVVSVIALSSMVLNVLCYFMVKKEIKVNTLSWIK